MKTPPRHTQDGKNNRNPEVLDRRSVPNRARGGAHRAAARRSSRPDGELGLEQHGTLPIRTQPGGSRGWIRALSHLAAAETAGKLKRFDDRCPSAVPKGPGTLLFLELDFAGQPSYIDFGGLPGS